MGKGVSQLRSILMMKIPTNYNQPRDDSSDDSGEMFQNLLPLLSQQDVESSSGISNSLDIPRSYRIIRPRCQSESSNEGEPKGTSEWFGDADTEPEDEEDSSSESDDDEAESDESLMISWNWNDVRLRLRDISNGQ